jgi:hypothetical protein
MFLMKIVYEKMEPPSPSRSTRRSHAKYWCNLNTEIHCLKILVMQSEKPLLQKDEHYISWLCVATTLPILASTEQIRAVLSRYRLLCTYRALPFETWTGNGFPSCGGRPLRTPKSRFRLQHSRRCTLSRYYIISAGRLTDDGVLLPDF